MFDRKVEITQSEIQTGLRLSELTAEGLALMLPPGTLVTLCIHPEDAYKLPFATALGDSPCYKDPSTNTLNVKDINGVPDTKDVWSLDSVSLLR